MCSSRSSRDRSARCRFSEICHKRASSSGPSNTTHLIAGILSLRYASRRCLPAIRIGEDSSSSILTVMGVCSPMFSMLAIKDTTVSSHMLARRRSGITIPSGEHRSKLCCFRKRDTSDTKVPADSTAGLPTGAAASRSSTLQSKAPASFSWLGIGRSASLPSAFISVSGCGIATDDIWDWRAVCPQYAGLVTY